MKIFTIDYSFFDGTSDVTFHIDMNGQTVSPNGVHIAGGFGDYDYDGIIENDEYPSLGSLVRLMMIMMGSTALH